MFYARMRGPQGTDAQHDFGSDGTWLCSAVKQDHWETPAFDPVNWSASTALGDLEMAPWRVTKAYLASKLGAAYPGTVRAALVAADPLLVALARPNREQVVTTRPSVATTLQALASSPAPEPNLIPGLYGKALGRKPTGPELQLAREMVGQPAQPSGVEDLLWSLAMLPEFQLIY